MLPFVKMLARLFSSQKKISLLLHALDWWTTSMGLWCGTSTRIHQNLLFQLVYWPNNDISRLVNREIHATSLKPIAPLPADRLSRLSKHEKVLLKGLQSISSCTTETWIRLLNSTWWDDVCIHVSCRANIGCAVYFIMSKKVFFKAFCLSLHIRLKGIAKYLRTTTRYRGGIVSPERLNPFLPTLIFLPIRKTWRKAKTHLFCWCRLWKWPPTKRRSTTGYDFTYSGGASIVYIDPRLNPLWPWAQPRRSLLPQSQLLKSLGSSYLF